MSRSAELESRSIISEAESAAWIIEQLEIDAGQAADRSRIRRALEESVAAWPGPVNDRWWRWMLEAGESLGLKCRVIDCTFQQILEIAREGGRVVVRSEATGNWLAIEEARGRKLLLIQPLVDASRQQVTLRQLREILGSPDRDAVVRCIVAEPQLWGMLAEEEAPRGMTPFARLVALMRPEAGDVWIVLLFALVAGVLAMATPLAIDALVSTVTFGRLLQPIVILSLMLLAFLSFQAAIRALQTYVVEILQRRVFARVAADLAYRLPRANVESLLKQSGRELVNRFFDIVTVQKITAMLLLDGVTIVLNTLVGMAVLGFYHPWLLGFDVVLLALIVFTIFVLGRGAIPTSIKESKCKYHLAAWLEDLAGCPLAFRYDGAMQFALERADRLTYEYLSARRKHFRIVMRQVIFALALHVLASTVLLGLGGWLVIAGQLTLGQLVAAELIVTVIISSFAKLGKHLEGYYDLLAAVDKLGILFDLPVERQDGLLSGLDDRPAEVSLRDVAYSYPDGRPVFEALTLTVTRGERVALQGPSGSGKSVLLDLLFGLRAPLAGRIAINRADPRELRPDILRRSVALVRDIEVFEGTLAENVHLERPEISTNAVRDALADAGLLEDVLALPQGLETELNSTGYPLSPNQMRKLMLARGIVARPTLLLIDGLLDALPDDEATGIMQRLVDRSQPWTLLLTTGRGSLAGLADRQVRLSPWGQRWGGEERLPQELSHAR